jgi:hypothetical protein
MHLVANFSSFALAPFLPVALRPYLLNKFLPLKKFLSAHVQHRPVFRFIDLITIEHRLHCLFYFTLLLPISKANPCFFIDDIFGIVNKQFPPAFTENFEKRSASVFEHLLHAGISHLFMMLF